MRDQVARIATMLREGKLTQEQAAELLEALSERAEDPGEDLEVDAELEEDDWE